MRNLWYSADLSIKSFKEAKMDERTGGGRHRDVVDLALLNPKHQSFANDVPPSRSKETSDREHWDHGMFALTCYPIQFSRL